MGCGASSATEPAAKLEKDGSASSPAAPAPAGKAEAKTEHAAVKEAEKQVETAMASEDPWKVRAQEDVRRNGQE